MTAAAGSERKLIGVLGGALLVELLVATLSGTGAHWLAMPGAVALLACVYLGMTRPGVAALVGALVLVGSSELIGRSGAVPQWVGIQNLLLSEMLAGGALVVLLAWRARPAVAVAGIATLVFACLAAIVLRGGRLPNMQSLSFGFAMLVGGVGVGIYLRLSRPERVGSELGALVRRQWPLGAVLALLLLFDFGLTGGELAGLGVGAYRDTDQLVVLGAAVVASVCAFLAPRAPVRFALIAAAAIGTATVPPMVAELIQASINGYGGDVFTAVTYGLVFSLAQLAASMALVAFVTRYARAQPAFWSTAALVAVNAGPLIGPSRAHVREDYLLPLVFLLIIAVVTGLYLRARDRERNQSVRVAVTGAQQAERMALARELHDVVAHHVTGIVVQAQAARMVAGRDPGVAVAALEKIENSGAEALVAMRTLVGSLRGAEPAGGATATATATSDLAADIRALVEQFTGPTVHLELSLPETLPHEMGRTVLRVVQESLTNVSKHAAGATGVWVGVGMARGDLGEELHVVVKDDGTARRSSPAGGSGGYGLIGMRERVELLGGWFGAGPGTEGGWVVTVKLPLRSMP